MCPDSDHGPDDRRPRSGISLQTLIVASVASAVASFAVARIWGPGTLFGAAAAPVIIALVSEGLRRPMRTVTATAKKVPSVPAVHGRGTPPTPVDPALAAAPETGTWRPRWWMAVVTGLVAFAIVLGVFTVPDLIAGSSITGNGQPTTFFGGSSKAKKTTRSTTTLTTTTRATTTTTATTTARTKTTTHAGSTSPTTTSTRSTTTPTTTTPTISTSPTTATSIATETAPNP
jgi:hypothetical protein